MSEFSVPLSQIDSNVRHFEFPITRSWLDGVLQGTDVRAPESAESGKLSFDAYLSGNDVIVTGRAETTLVVACSRCLEDVKVKVATELAVVMGEPPEDVDPNADDVELADDDLGREYLKGDEIELDDIVRDHLLLELPMQPRCAPPGCPEWVNSYLTSAEDAAAAAEKAKPAIDPRLAPLAGLKDKLKKPN